MKLVATQKPARASQAIASGYPHGDYAASFADLGVPRFLSGCEGWLLERQIPDSESVDLTGCYPLFSCLNWSKLRDDLEQLSGEPVSVALVTDPFGDYDEDYLKQCFRDVVVPFKQHYVADLSQDPETFVHAHHRRNTRKAQEAMHVEKCEDPPAFLDEWVTLYANLEERHDIAGITAFSRETFAKQLTVPGMVVFRSMVGGETVGALLWYVQGDVAYYHLGAYSQQGYDLRASFALFSKAIEYFSEAGLRWLSLGGGAGVSGSGTDGLSRFKQGWSTGSRTAYFCGRILNRAMYDRLVEKRKIPATQYFPAYRLGEFK